MIHDCIIIGGGIAGLSAANKLVDLGIKPVVIESSDYPSHKVCGEFYSPECITYLKAWGIHPPTTIDTIKFSANNNTFEMTLDIPAGGISRALCDLLLMQRAQQCGATIHTRTKVMNLKVPQKNEPYELTLSTGALLQAHQVIIATGRYSLFAQQYLHQSHEPITFIGIKTHFAGIDLGSQLTMYAFDNAYLGHSHIEDGNSNISCLARIEDVRHAGGASAYMQQLLAHKKAHTLANTLQHGKQLFDWITCSAPRFGKRKLPQWPRAYIIGDAAGAITPACGDGLAMAITSGHMVGDYVVQQHYEGFRHAWNKRYSKRLKWGIGLHEIMLKPSCSSAMLAMCSFFPSIPQFLLEATREK